MSTDMDAFQARMGNDTADEEAAPPIKDRKSFPLPCEIMETIGSILLDTRQYRTLASLIASSRFMDASMLVIGRKFFAVDGDDEAAFDEIAGDDAIAYIQHMLLTGTKTDQLPKAILWPTLQDVKGDQQHVLKAVGYWFAVQPLETPSTTSAAPVSENPVGESFRFERGLDVFSSTVA